MRTRHETRWFGRAAALIAALASLMFAAMPNDDVPLAASAGAAADVRVASAAPAVETAVVRDAAGSSAVSAGDVATTAHSELPSPARSLQRHRLVGVPRELVPHVRLRISDDAKPFRLDADGVFFAEVRDGPHHWIEIAGVAGRLVRTVEPDEILLRCDEPLVGFVFSDGAAQREFALRNERGARAHGRAMVHLWSRRALGDRLLVFLDGSAPVEVRSADVPSAGAMVDLAQLPRRDFAALDVTIDDADKGVLAGAVLLRLVRPDGEVAATAQVFGGTTPGPRPHAGFDAVEPGAYELRWQWGGRDCGVAATHLVLRGGERAKFTTTWPTLVQWTGRVVGHASAPVDRRFPFVRFGDSTRILGSLGATVAADGTFHLELPPGVMPPPAVLWQERLRVDAEVFGLDPRTATLEIGAPAGVRWVTVRADAGCELAVVELPPSAVWIRDGHAQVVPVAPGTTWAGALYERVTADAPVAWVAIDGVTQDVLLVPAPRRSVRIVCTRPGSRVDLAFVGPLGQSANPFPMEGGSERTLQVPTATRGVLVTTQPEDGSPPLPRREITLRSDDVVVVD